MEPITIGIVVGAIGLCAAIGSFFAAKHVYEPTDSTQKDINNQLIILQEKDNSHEFAQTVCLVMFGVILCFIIFVFCTKFVTNWCLSRMQKMNRQANIIEA